MEATGATEGAATTTAAEAVAKAKVEGAIAAVEVGEAGEVGEAETERPASRSRSPFSRRVGRRSFLHTTHPEVAYTSLSRQRTARPPPVKFLQERSLQGQDM